MWNRSGVQGSALERAMAQLSGHKLTNRTGVVKRNELEQYMDTLTKKTRPFQVGQSPFQNTSNIFSSEESQVKPKASDNRAPWAGSSAEIGGMGSRFLKKAPPHHSAVTSFSPELSKRGTSTSVTTPQSRSQSMALSRLALIEDRIKNHMQATDRLGGRAAQRALEERAACPESSSDQSMRGSRFLKKKTMIPTVLQQDPKVTFSSRYSAAQPGLFSSGVSFDSDEEDMKRLLGGSPGPESSPLQEGKAASRKGLDSQTKSFLRSSKKLQASSPPLLRSTSEKGNAPSPSASRQELQDYVPFHGHESPSYSVLSSSVVCSPSPPNVPPLGRTAPSRGKSLRPSLSPISARSDVRSLEELFVRDPSFHDSISEGTETSDDFKMNIMTLDDLAPDNLENSERYKDKAVSTTEAVKYVISPSNSLNIVDFNEARNEGVQTAEDEYESDFESEIKTETDQVSSSSELYKDDMSTVSKGRSSVSERLQHEFSSLSEEDSKIQSSALESPKSKPAQHSESSGNSRDPRSRSASQLDTITPPLSKGVPGAGRALRETATQTHDDGLTDTWSTGAAALGPTMGTAHMDPAPVSCHVISAETVKALTAYSPAVVALNDMLRQQLCLTRHFVETSRHLHASALESLGPANYQYTTLEDTKEFIERHKPAILSVEEALEDVLREMREYHYI